MKSVTRPRWPAGVSADILADIPRQKSLGSLGRRRMRQGPERHRSTGLNRREFLGGWGASTGGWIGGQGFRCQEHRHGAQDEDDAVCTGHCSRRPRGCGRYRAKGPASELSTDPGMRGRCSGESQLGFQSKSCRSVRHSDGLCQLEELLEDEGIDAVMIGTPPYMHRILTLEARERETRAVPVSHGHGRTRGQ